MRQFGFQYATIWRKAKLSLCFCYINECFSVLLRLDFLSIAYIAQSKNVLPQHVYEIAHGKKPQTREDETIFEELMALGIIVNTYV